MSPAVNAVTLADRAEGMRCFDPDHRSQSGDRRWDTCSWLDHAVRDLGVVDFMGPEACVGSVVDAALVEIIGGGAPNLAGLLEGAIAEMADPVSAGMWDRTELLTKAARLVDLAGDRVLPSYAAHGGVHASQLELHFEVDGAPYHVHIDLVLGDGTIVDWKTSEKRLPDLAAHTSPQLTSYAYAIRAEYGQLPPGVILDGLIYANPPTDVRDVDPTAVKPWWDRKSSTRTPEQLDAWLDDFRRREAARRWSQKTDIYPTQGRSGMEFVCGRCPAKPVCPSWFGTR